VYFCPNNSRLKKSIVLELLALAFFLAYAKNSAGLAEPQPKNQRPIPVK
jgi:hypothetical protein